MYYSDKCGICNNCGAPLTKSNCFYCGQFDERMYSISIANPETRLDLVSHLVSKNLITKELAIRLLLPILHSPTS
mgnify:CR=1 FL=1